MLQIGSKISITAEQAKDILTRHTTELGVFIDLDRVCEYQSFCSHKIRPILAELEAMSGQSDLELTKRPEIRSILISRFGVPIHKFYNKKDRDKTPKFNKEVINNLLVDQDITEDARRFVELFTEADKFRQKISGLGQYVQLPLCKRESYDGHRMVLAQPTWSVLSTGRISAQNPSIQNMDRAFGDLITYPAGYIMVHADSGQIEPRIIYSAYVNDPRIKELITMYNDAYYGLVHYVLHNESNEKMEITDQLKGYRSQLKTMANATNYGGALEGKGFDPELSRVFLARVQHHPLREKWLAEVEEAVANGATTFYSFFGTPIKPESNSNYETGGDGWQGHLVRCGVNNPIQATAGDLMCESVYQSDVLLRTKARGYSRICDYKHDAGRWYLAECDADLADELAGYMSYQVPGWIPIYSDMTVGREEGMETIFDYS
jgi:hypothetical protein